MNDDSVYLIELTNHKNKDITYYPFVIWQCFGSSLNSYNNTCIEKKYGKIKAVWGCDSVSDAENWREEILKMRGQEDLI